MFGGCGAIVKTARVEGSIDLGNDGWLVSHHLGGRGSDDMVRSRNRDQRAGGGGGGDER